MTGIKRFEMRMHSLEDSLDNTLKRIDDVIEKLDRYEERIQSNLDAIEKLKRKLEPK